MNFVPTKVGEYWFPVEQDFFTQLAQRHELESFGREPRLRAIQLCTNHDCVIDIGAHVGISVRHWAQHFDHVEAFEPMPEHMHCLRLNTRHLSNIQYHEIAVSDQDGNREAVYRTGKNTGSVTLIDTDWADRKARQRFCFETRCLDSYQFDRHVDLIKIDVEGWEFEVLLGAKRTITQHRPVLQVEFTGGDWHKGLHHYDIGAYHQLIEELDYEFVERSHGDNLYVPR